MRDDEGTDNRGGVQVREKYKWCRSVNLFSSVYCMAVTGSYYCHSKAQVSPGLLSVIACHAQHWLLVISSPTLLHSDTLCSKGIATPHFVMSSHFDTLVGKMC